MPSKNNPLQMSLGFCTADLPRALAESTTKWVNLTPIYLLLCHPHRDKGAAYPTAGQAPKVQSIYLGKTQGDISNFLFQKSHF